MKKILLLLLVTSHAFTHSDSACFSGQEFSKVRTLSDRALQKIYGKKILYGAEDINVSVGNEAHIRNITYLFYRGDCSTTIDAAKMKVLYANCSHY